MPHQTSPAIHPFPPTPPPPTPLICHVSESLINKNKNSSGQKVDGWSRSAKAQGASHSSQQWSGVQAGAPGDGARIDPIKNHRVGRSFCSFTFMSGDKGPGCTAVSDIQIRTKSDAQIIEDLNEQLKGQFKIMRTHSKTHFWNQKMVVRYLWEVVGPGYREQRAKYGLEGKWGLLMWDSFGGNKAVLTKAERDEWSEAFMVYILGQDRISWKPLLMYIYIYIYTRLGVIYDEYIYINIYIYIYISNLSNL